MTMRPEDLDPAALLRCGADDELCKEGERRLREHLADHPEDASRMEFDKELCDAIGRVMCECEPPAGLRERIEASCCGQCDSVDMSDTTKRSFWARPFGSIVSVAATLILAFVMVQLVTGIIGGGTTAAHAAEIRSFVGSQHAACVDGDPGYDKFDVNIADQIPAQFEKLTGTPISMEGLTVCQSVGLKFLDAGECGVPPRNKAKSYHLRYVSDGTRCEKGTVISLFIQPDVGYIPMLEGHTYRIDGKGRRTVYGWTHAGVVYYVVADAREPCELFRRAAGMPEPEALPVLSR